MLHEQNDKKNAKHQSSKTLHVMRRQKIKVLKNTHSLQKQVGGKDNYGKFTDITCF